MSFGSCCKDLAEALLAPETPLLRVSEEGILYLTIGSVKTKMGVGWMEQAVMFCPFCGARLQSNEEIQAKGGEGPATVH